MMIKLKDEEKGSVHKKELIKQREAILQEGKKVNDTISHTIEATI